MTPGQPPCGLAKVRIPTRCSKATDAALSAPVPATIRRTPSAANAWSISARSASVA
jgi:hypothetical protein